MIDVILQPVKGKRKSSFLFEKAHVAELVDAADSKSAVRKGVKVRFLSWAPMAKSLHLFAGILF